MAWRETMKRFALTGGFGSGKSTVGRMFEDLGLPRIDADVLVHNLMVAGSDLWQEIVSYFGEKVLQPDRQIDRNKLAEWVFHDPAQRKKLEAMVHPKVRSALRERTEQLKQKGATRVLLEIPLLFEAGWDRDEKWDAVIVVYCEAAVQKQRAAQKFGLTSPAVRARMDAQHPLSEKKKRADFVIDNSGSLDATRQQVEAIFQQLPS